VPPGRIPHPRRPSDTATSLADLRGRLGALEPARLIDLVIDAARNDPALERRLRLAAARAGRDPAALGDSVERVFARGGRLDYWQAVRYAQAGGEVADALAVLVRDGDPADACPLLERAIALLQAALDDADDRAGTLADLMRRLLANHAAACAGARPDPEALARWLVGFQFGGPAQAGAAGRSVTFVVDIAEYAAVLGDAGLASYRAAIRRRWTEDPGDPQARAAAERLARLDRDVDTLVAVVGGDLRHAAQYGRLARALHEIGADDDALLWAERGLRAHPADPPGVGLRDFLVEAYLRRGGRADAVRLRREGLRAAPGMAAYVALRKAAQESGRWPHERAAALSVLRDRNPADHVRALLYEEDDAEAAWSAAARTRASLGGVVWDDLARRRAAERPAEALPVLRRRVEEVLQASGREAYRDAARRLVELRDISRRVGQGAQFEAYLRELTDRHRRRPSLLAELTSAGLVAA
jgi:tetratricopeptide (TPR) repeat protein